MRDIRNNQLHDKNYKNYKNKFKIFLMDLEVIIKNKYT